jgi:hypothetical protein
MRAGLVLSCFVVMALLPANGERHRINSSVRSAGGASAADATLNSAAARQRARKTDLKKLETRSAHLAVSSESPRNSRRQQIKPLRMDGSSGGKGTINFKGSSHRIRSGGSGARGSRRVHRGR